jgi:hypothetical protein
LSRGGNYKCIHAFSWKAGKERDHLGDLGLDGRIMLRKVLENKV